MELRLVEIYCPGNRSDQLHEIIKNYRNLDERRQTIDDNWLLTRVLLPEELVEKFTDDLNKRFSAVEGFRVLISGIAATLPRPEPDEDKLEETQAQKEQEAKANAGRISREELYNAISNGTKLSRTFIVLSVLSTIVAAIGLVQNNLAVIIGAMVIAPLLGPNVALSLSTTLADTELARRAIKSLGIGILIVLVLSVLLGFILNVNPDTPEIASRTIVSIGDILIALASGSAGALAFTTSLSTALVGVMVAVALLPPLVTLGMLLGSQYLQPAFGALLLVLINIASINLAAVGTFIFQGIRPAQWWEAEKAKKATRIAVILWIALLAILIVLIFVSRHTLNFDNTFKLSY